MWLGVRREVYGGKGNKFAVGRGKELWSFWGFLAASLAGEWKTRSWTRANGVVELKFGKLMRISRKQSLSGRPGF